MSLASPPNIPTEVRCATCARYYERFTLGLVGRSSTDPADKKDPVCCKCGAPGYYALPVIPECPGTDVALTQHADGTLHWDGGTGLCGAPGVEGSTGAEPLHQPQPRFYGPPSRDGKRRFRYA